MNIGDMTKYTFGYNMKISNNDIYGVNWTYEAPKFDGLDIMI